MAGFHLLRLWWMLRSPPEAHLLLDATAGKSRSATGVMGKLLCQWDMVELSKQTNLVLTRTLVAEHYLHETPFHLPAAPHVRHRQGSHQYFYHKTGYYILLMRLQSCWTSKFTAPTSHNREESKGRLSTNQVPLFCQCIGTFLRSHVTSISMYTFFSSPLPSGVT